MWYKLNSIRKAKVIQNLFHVAPFFDPLVPRLSLSQWIASLFPPDILFRFTPFYRLSVRFTATLVYSPL